VSDSTHENYPTADEATRDATGPDEGDPSLQFSATFVDAEGGTIPEHLGDYVITRLLGSGGMGQVFLAEHTRMRRVVAIKMLPIDRMKDARAVERFYDEVRAASRLMHPNIVTAFDAGESDGIHYLAMEYIDGLTLTSIVARKGPLSVGEAASVIRQAALGLLHAHQAGIVHRDVKPGNLMRASDGTVKVLDLGLARISSMGLVDETGQLIEAPATLPESKSRGKLVGTLPFMSPEQLEDPDTADPRSDIYSLGATLFFLLAGRPPYTGEYLDQVYGHRHGDIPDLMQLRDDVDLKFANLFRRMMAKSPDQRYASLDEVIDDLSDYTDQSDTPLWMAQFTQRQTGQDMSTASGGSTTGQTGHVLAIDVGMFYSATAEASPVGGVNLLTAGSENRALFRMAVASDNENRLVYGTGAMERRSEDAKHLVHCLPMYIGKQLVEREIAGRRCPPEVLLAVLLRRISQNAWTSKSAPDAAALTVPASYDQLHRQSVLQAARMAGLKSVRLVDRCVAACQTLLMDTESESIDQTSTSIRQHADRTILFVGLTGQSTETAILRCDESRLHQLSTTGHWHSGTLPWLHRLVEMSAAAFVRTHDLDPRQSTQSASRLQIACERAMNSLLLLPTANITVKMKRSNPFVTIDRNAWLSACQDHIEGVRTTILRACEQASVSLSDIDTCVTMGPLLRIAEVRRSILGGLNETTEFHTVDRTDVARGAAACLAGELPGRGDIATPPHGITSQTIGIVVEDARGRRRILPIIPKGTSLPARTNRRLTVGKDRATMTLSLVESSGVEGDEWHSLGRHDFEIHGDPRQRLVRTRMIGFEIDMNGILTVRAQTPGSPGSNRLPALPEPTLAEDAIPEWTQWIADVR
jgi:serine/threonine protein kinase/molecular chaperone DnaK (HSP70)